MSHKNQVFAYKPRAFYNLMDHVLKHGQRSTPRGIGTTELIAAKMVLSNPVDRVVPHESRKMNIAFGIAEFIAIMTGIEDIGYFTQFIKEYDKFSSNGFTLDGAYGPRVVRENGQNQIVQIIELLRKDPESRRALVVIYDWEDTFGGGGKNTPCTLNFQFLLRNNELDMITTMRSNDVVRGVTYDVFVFTMVHEFVARQLGVKVGEYHHHAGSLHVYDTDLDLLTSQDRHHRWPRLMAEMPKIEVSDLELIADVDLKDDEAYKAVRDAKSWSSGEARHYCLNLLNAQRAFVIRKQNNRKAREITRLISDQTIKFVTYHWLGRGKSKKKSDASTVS